MTISHNVPQTIIGIQVLGAHGYAFGLETQPTVPALETRDYGAAVGFGQRWASRNTSLASAWVRSVAQRACSSLRSSRSQNVK
jgi:hypothetical protein